MENIACDYCGSRESETQWIAPDRLTNTGEFFSVVKCSNCGLAFVNPRPEIGEINQYYQSDYWAYVRLTRIRWWLKKIILYRELKILKKILPPSAKILEVGTGSGEDMAFLRDRGKFTVQGLDISHNAVSTGRREFGLNIEQGELESKNYPESFFDLVRLKFIISHVHQPKRFLIEVNRILKPGGHILMWVPNFSSWSQKIFRDFWLGGEPPRHLYDFSEITLTNYLKATNFKILKLRHSIAPNVFVHCFRYWLAAHGVPKLFVIFFSINIFSLIVFMPFSLLASLFRASDRLFIIAQKIK